MLDDGTLDVESAVVVGCSETPASDEALRFAVREARLRRVPLVVLATYLRPVDPDVESFDTPDDVLAAGARARCQAALQRVVAKDEVPLPEHRIVTACGLPGRVLLKDFGNAGLIVVGAHQRHLFGRILHGETIGGDLIHHSKVPVVVVPDSITLPRGRHGAGQLSVQ